MLTQDQQSLTFTKMTIRVTFLSDSYRIGLGWFKYFKAADKNTHAHKRMQIQKELARESLIFKLFTCFTESTKVNCKNCI